MDPSNPPQFRGLDKIVHDRQPILSSVDGLPAEILVEIFIQAIPTRSLGSDTDFSVEKQFDHKIRFALSQVCCYWRTVALAIPQLWSSIYVWPRDRLKSSRLVAFTKMCIKRSGSVPLHITIILADYELDIETDSKSEESTGTGIPALLNLIFSYAHRWKTAIIHLHDHNSQGFPLASLDFPILESLKLKHSYPYGFSHPHALRNTPSLRYVVDDSFLSRVPLPWSQLWHYAGFPWDLESMRPAGSELRTCVLRSPLCVAKYPSSVIVFSKLNSLRIINRYHSDIPYGTEFGTIFRWIAAPVLENLEIGRSYELEASFIVTELHLTMLAWPSTTLRSISFHVSGITENDLRRLLSSTPRLTTLDICDVPASIFTCLLVTTSETPSQSMEPLAPRLQSLVIHSFSHPDAAVLLDVYNSRHHPSNVDEMKVVPLGITLLYLSFHACRKAQCRNAEGDGVDIKALRKILGWCGHLVKQFLAGFPEKADKYNVPHYRRMYSAKELDIFFRNVIETYQFSDSMIIETSRIARILSEIRDLPPSAILDDNDYEFRKRVGNILESWAPLLEDIPSRRRWALGEDYLTLRACSSKLQS